LISTSANIHGQPPPLSLGEVEPRLLEDCFLIDATPEPAGTPSTLLDCTASPPGILRQGEVRVEGLVI